MDQSPLNLTKYFFTKTTIEANPEHNPKNERGFSVDISARLTKISTEKYQLEFNINIKEDKAANCPYFGDVQVVGVFSIKNETSPTDKVTIIHIEGGELLYSAAREHILSITSRGPWGGVILPTIGHPTEKDIEALRESAKELA